MRRGSVAEVGGGDLATLLDGVARVLRASYGVEIEIEELAQDAVTKFLELAATDVEKVTRIRKPAAYLIRLAQNLAIERARADSRSIGVTSTEDLDTLPTNDDAIAALLDAVATARVVEAAMRAAVAADDHVAVRVVAEWLDLAQESGRAPSSRGVAQRASISHTSVNNALRRFREYLRISSAGPG